MSTSASPATGAAALLSTYARSQALITFLHGMSASTVPDKVMQMARHCLLDTLGCALFGSGQLHGRKSCARKWRRKGRRADVAGVFGTGLKLAAPAAARCATAPRCTALNSTTWWTSRSCIRVA